MPKPMLTVAEMVDERRPRIEAETGPMFLSLPDRWLESPTWRCQNGHVSKRFLKSEERGDLCLACGSFVLLTSPEDREAATPEGTDA